MNRNHLAGCLALVLVGASLSPAATLHVPDEYGTIQEAIDVAVNGDTVLVADGIYSGAGNKDLTYDGKEVTIMSANGPESTILDCEGEGRGLYASSVGAGSKFLGFSVINGNADSGGGIHCNIASPVIKDCIISGNTAVDGGGIYISSSSHPHIINCTVSLNTASSEVGDGGGIYSMGSFTIRECIIADNQGTDGGGINSITGDLTCTNCTIAGNTASSYGGGVYCYGSRKRKRFTHCTLVENTAGSGGGGIYCYRYVRFWVDITNCILWDDSPDELGGMNYYTVTYSDIEGGWSGEGNIDADPLFVGVGDYHLLPESPCIDTATDAGVASDIDGDYRPLGASFDIGSDEYLVEAAIISVNPESFSEIYEVGEPVSDEIVSIASVGSLDLEYSVIAGSEPWLILDGDLGGLLAPGDSAFVILQFDVSDLENGMHRDTIEVTSSDPLNPSISIPIALTLYSHGVIHVPGEVATIQEAIDLAIDGDTILIADGIYTGDGNKNISFHGKEIIVRSENGAESTIIDCEHSGGGFIFDSMEDYASKLGGLSILNATESGIQTYNSSPTISRCRLVDNYATAGGGVFCIGSLFAQSSPEMTDCVITGNIGGYSGGGIALYEYCSPTIMNCVISGNTAEEPGGGIYWAGPYGGWIHLDVDNCCIIDNSAGTGGGIYAYEVFASGGNLSQRPRNRNERGIALVSNCVISSNTADRGGALAVVGSGDVRVTNATFSANSNYAVYDKHAGLVLTNCILWGDSPGEIDPGGHGLVIWYSDVEGGYGGTGNIDESPEFIPFPVHGFEYLLKPVSPCIDAGDPSIEDALYDWHPRWPDWYPDDARSDMGAYGGPGNINWIK